GGGVGTGWSTAGGEAPSRARAASVRMALSMARKQSTGRAGCHPSHWDLEFSLRPMPTLGLIVEPSTTPSASRFTDAALLERAVARGHGSLRVSVPSGPVLALGRYPLAPAGAPDVTLHRRLSSGRACASGAGFVQVSLTLPHRSALVSDDPLALAPEQILNRGVRGLLGGLDAGGVSAPYPGRGT